MVGMQLCLYPGLICNLFSFLKCNLSFKKSPIGGSLYFTHLRTWTMQYCRQLPPLLADHLVSVLLQPKLTWREWSAFSSKAFEQQKPTEAKRGWCIWLMGSIYYPPCRWQNKRVIDRGCQRQALDLIDKREYMTKMVSWRHWQEGGGIVKCAS